MIGKTVSHYNILEKLGEGGMGVVYKAEDTKLDRIVALKFLTPHAVGNDDERARFLHEAKAAAALNHPNICTIHEIADSEDGSFIAMEYVEGEPLKTRIESGPLKLGETIENAVQVANGLSEAHERRIVHRDIKPGNIMLTPKGVAKIMDFGLAKSPGRTQLTRTGTTVGTAAYMSPEQSRGIDVDHRTDIWSLGVVLYEMVAGKRPFRGDHEQAVLYSIANETPEPLTGLRTGVPLELERVVDKCLEKDPAERYQTAADLIADLRRLQRKLSGESAKPRPWAVSRVGGRGVRWWPWASAFALVLVFAVGILPRYLGPSSRRSAPARTMLVVLPFENLGPADDEYFADGITDAITARLAGIHGLGVVSRQSAVQYKARDKSIQEIGEELGVEYVLEGTVQRERPSDPASRVRVIPQLVRVSDDVHLWAETYDEDMAEVFRVQSEIAERVATELDVTLFDTERRVLGAKPTENLEAYEYYLRGKDHYHRGNSPAAVNMYEEAVALDPDFAVAWAALSREFIWLYWLWGVSDGVSKAEAAAERALRLDPDLPDAHVAWGYLYYYGSRDYEKALGHFTIAQRRRPSDAEAAEAIGLILRRQGKWEKVCHS